MISSPVKRFLIQFTLTFVIFVDITLVTMQANEIQNINSPTEWCKNKIAKCSGEEIIKTKVVDVCIDALKSYPAKIASNDAKDTEKIAKDTKNIAKDTEKIAKDTEKIEGFIFATDDKIKAKNNYENAKIDMTNAKDTKKIEGFIFAIKAEINAKNNYENAKIAKTKAEIYLKEAKNDKENAKNDERNADETEKKNGSAFRKAEFIQNINGSAFRKAETSEKNERKFNTVKGPIIIDKTDFHTNGNITFRDKKGNHSDGRVVYEIGGQRIRGGDYFYKSRISYVQPYYRAGRAIFIDNRDFYTDDKVIFRVEETKLFVEGTKLFETQSVNIFERTNLFKFMPVNLYEKIKLLVVGTKLFVDEKMLFGANLKRQNIIPIFFDGKLIFKDGKTYSRAVYFKNKATSINETTNILLKNAANKYENAIKDYNAALRKYNDAANKYENAKISYETNNTHLKNAENNYKNANINYNREKKIFISTCENEYSKFVTMKNTSIIKPPSNEEKTNVYI